MKRPTIKEKAAQEYATYLEDRIAQFEAETTINSFYLGLKKQVENISKLFHDIEVTEEDLKSKEDKFFDRYFKYLEKADAIAEGLIKMQNRVAPPKDTQKIRDDASVEQYIFQEEK